MLCVKLVIVDEKLGNVIGDIKSLEEKMKKCGCRLALVKTDRITEIVEKQCLSETIGCEEVMIVTDYMTPELRGFWESLGFIKILEVSKCRSPDTITSTILDKCCCPQPPPLCSLEAGPGWLQL